MTLYIKMVPPATFANEQAKQLLDAQAHIWNHIFSFHNSMALKCAIELGIPDAIQKHGKPISLDVLANSLAIYPAKFPSLHRLMRLLVNSDFFSMKKLDNGEMMFDLTMNSQLLVKEHPLSQAPAAILVLIESMTDPAHHLSTWFKNDAETPFHVAHRRSLWEQAQKVSMFNESFNQAMASDARFVARLLTDNAEAKGVFEGIKSLTDVAGGDGTTAKAIVEAYPELKCVVFDLPHVIEGLQGNGSTLVYVSGDMFQSIPPADAILLKWILHDWSDEQCVKILERCKEAIPHKDQGGKIIIIDMVVDNQNNTLKHYSTQLLFDMQMLSVMIGGKERTEEDWNKLFLHAGFSDYKVFSILGLRSVIEIYPS